MASKEQKPRRSIAFFGASDQQVASFEEQTRDFLQTYCPGLTDTANPSSYILPPRFAYSRPHDLCDKDCSDLEAIGACEGESPLKERYACEAEKLMFDTILKLIRYEIGGPFLAVHSLDLKLALGSSIRRQLFPSLTDGFIRSVEPCLREFDFILIGPRIGLIAVEVKGSKFSQARDFAHGQDRLHDRYAHGLKQLNTIDHLVQLFKECAKFEIPAGSIRRILFAPRLQKSRYMTWFDGLSSDQKERIEKSVGKIQQWFEEDLREGLFEKMRREIEESTIDYTIDGETFRQGIWIHAALKSSATFRDAYILNHETKVASVFSSDHAFVEDCASIERQRLEIETKKRQRQHLKISSDKILLLTPEQQVAANGTNRQILLGTAGTGKSCVFMQRAIELEKGGRTVLVLAMESFMQTYRDVLEANGCKRYEIRSWANVKYETWSKIRDSPRVLWKIYRNSKYIVDLASEYVLSNQHNPEYLNDVFEILASSEFDAVLIDDVFDFSNSDDFKSFLRTKSMFLSGAMMAFGSNWCPEKSIWVAFDVFKVEWMADRNYRVYREAVEKLIKTSTNPGDYFSCSVLRRVLRSSEKVFSVAFNADVAHQLGASYYSPFSGHNNTATAAVYRKLIPSSSPDETATVLWSNVKTVLDRLTSLSVPCPFGQIGILVGGSRGIEYIVELLLQQCKKFKIPAERLDWKLNYEAILNGSTAYSPSTRVDNDKVTIDCWQQASSREWRYVIFVEVNDFRQLSRPFNDHRIHQGYRARTRAIGELIEFSIVEHYSDDGGARICCSREVELYHDKNDRVRYFQSDLHTTRCKGFRTNVPKTRLANLNDSIEFASYFRDDLAWDIEHYEKQLRKRKGKIRLQQTSNDKSGVDKEKRKKKFVSRSHSIHDLRLSGPVINRHPALNLDCDLYERYRAKFDLMHYETGRSVKTEDIGRHLTDRLDPTSNLWKKWEVIRMMERALRDNNAQLTEKQVDTLARCVESISVPDEFEKCVNEVMSSLSPIRAEYLRVNLIEICENVAIYDYRDFMETERQTWRH